MESAQNGQNLMEAMINQYDASTNTPINRTDRPGVARNNTCRVCIVPVTIGPVDHIDHSIVTGTL